eukprot:m.14937 g.14937  ORF g.14937 m.14937 type:complete len:224 (+) comp7787_c0_seq1:34-705(+)
MDDEEDKHFKLLLLGPPFAGKSSLLAKYMDLGQDAIVNMTSSIQMDVGSKKLKNNVTLHINDIPGQKSFTPMVSSYARGTNAVALVFALDDANSFSQVKTYHDDFISKSNITNVVKVLVGNKSDVRATVSEVAARNLAKELGCVDYIVTSALTGTNVDECFELVVSLLDEERSDGDEDDESTNGNTNGSTVTGNNPLKTKFINIKTKTPPKEESACEKYCSLL